MTEPRSRIIQSYSHFLRKHGRAPASVFEFCESIEISEEDFFRSFGSFDSVESELWKSMLHSVTSSISSGPEWEGFSAKQRTLTFLFAFLDASLAMRSLLLIRKDGFRPLATSRPVWLRGFAAEHKGFMADVLARGYDSGEIADRGALSGFYPELFFTHLLAVIDFHLRDDSQGFERTDAFVEKSVAVAFDLIRTQAVDSGVDLVRFLISCR